MGATVLVTGPRRAGVTSLLVRLRERMPGVRFVEAPQPGADPAAVVFVVSAVAPVTASDCALAARMTGCTDAVIAVVAKVDDHRAWREVLDVSRRRLAAEVPRFGSVPWVGAAPAPRLGAPRVDDVVDLVSAALDDPGLARRNTLRGWEARIGVAVEALRSGAVQRQAQVDVLTARRDEAVRARRLAASQRALAARAAIQRTRLELTFAARDRCAALRTRLLDAVADAPRAAVGGVAEHARRQCAQLVAEVDDLISVRLRELAGEFAVPAIPGPDAVPAPRIADPPVRVRHLEARLTTVLGAGFGFGAGLVLARFLSGLVPGHTVAGSLAGAVVGLSLTLWVVGARAVLQQRAALHQWVVEATTAARAALEERIAIRLLAAESALASARLTADSSEDAAAAARIAGWEAELAGLARTAARTDALAHRCEPALGRALTAVRHGLRIAKPGRTLVTER